MKRETRIPLEGEDRSFASFFDPELEHPGFHVRCDHDSVAGLDGVFLA
jgi:hypothetical protein